MCTVSEQPVVVAPQPLGARTSLPTGSAAPLRTGLETSVAFRSELVKKWGQAPRKMFLLQELCLQARSQSPFLHKLGAKGDT